MRIDYYSLRLLIFLVWMLNLHSLSIGGESDYPQQGDRYLAAGKYSEAILEYKKALKTDPDNAIVNYNLAYSYEKLGQYSHAIKYFQKAAQLNPQDEDTYFLMGFSYNQLGQYKKAIENYEKALLVDPNDAVTCYNIGLAYFYLKKYEQAIQYYEMALKIDPQYKSVYNNIGYVYGHLNQHHEAIKYYEKILGIDPDDDYANNNIGYSYSKLNQNEKAIPYFEKAIQSNPNYIEAYNNLGDAYSKLGDLGKAKQNYQIAKKLSQISANPNMILVTEPSERISIMNLSFLPPYGEGWHLQTNSSVGGLYYANGDSPSHTFGCNILAVAVDKEFENVDQFLGWVKQSHQNDTNPKRFKNEEYSYDLNKRFGFYCVKYKGKAMDTQRKAADGTYLVFKMEGYMFIHPKFPKYAINIGYSERGVTQDFTPSFQKVANGFIDSLLVEE